jgi:putative flippase GtrA
LDTLTQTAPPTPDPATPEPHGPFSSMRRLMPPMQVIRFLAVGVWNTVFALLLSTALVSFYSHILPHKWILFTADFASFTAKPIAITMAFLCYKHFVFHTKGNYLREWVKCFAVYGVGMIPELIALPLVTKCFLLFPLGFLSPLFARFHISNPAAVLAILVVAVFTAIYSYFAHKKFSFKR